MIITRNSGFIAYCFFLGGLMVAISVISCLCIGLKLIVFDIFIRLHLLLILQIDLMRLFVH